MSSSFPAAVEHNPHATVPTQPQSIESRFGTITIHPEQAILFPTGLLGMPEKTQFCLARFPSEKMARFHILQSLEDLSTAFITLPLDVDNPIIERADLEAAATDLEVTLAEIVVLLIVTVHRQDGKVQLTVNARAPVIMHVQRRVAAQYVFPHSKYEIRQPLAL